MALGRSLSEESQRALIKAKIRPGCILHTFCDFIENPKNKFFVVAHVDFKDELLLIFIINSRIPRFIENNPDLKAGQICLKSLTYPYLDHDSYLNCVELHDELDIDTLVDHLLKTPSDFKGYLSSDDILATISAVGNARTISEYDKALIVKSLNQTIQP
jgi:hypothetical protein